MDALPRHFTSLFISLGGVEERRARLFLLAASNRETPNDYGDYKQQGNALVLWRRFAVFLPLVA